MVNKNTTLLLLIANLVLILLIVIEKVLAVDYFYLNALLVLLLIIAAFFLLFSAISFITFDLFLGIILTICLAFLGLQKGYGIVFLILAFASIILFLMSIINVSTYSISLPKPKKPEIIVYGEEDVKEKEKERKEKIYKNFYDVDELVKEAQEFEEAQRYIDEQMKNINDYKESPKEGLKIITKASSKKKSRKAKVLKKRIKRLPLPFKFVASKTGKNFHESKCLAVRKIKPKMRVWFKTKGAAKTKGFKPCPICLP